MPKYAVSLDSDKPAGQRLNAAAKAEVETLIEEGGPGGSVAWDEVADKPAVIAAGEDQASARAAIAAETTANRNQPNGYLGLGPDGKAAAAQLPSYVDDVLEFANLAAFPATGETGKIYVALDTNRTYRWGGSAYVEISPSPGSTDAVPEGAANLYYTQARADARVNALAVRQAGDESIAGTKTFTGAVAVPTSTTGEHAVNNTRLAAALAGVGGGGSAPFPVPMKKLRAYFAVRNNGPIALFAAGSSTTAGQSASTAAARWFNRLVARLQEAYPLDSGTEPATQAFPTTAPSLAGGNGLQGINVGNGGEDSDSYLMLAGTARNASTIGNLNPALVLHQATGTDFRNQKNPATAQTDIEARVAAIDAAADDPPIHVFLVLYGRWDFTASTYDEQDYVDMLQNIVDADPDHRMLIDLREDFAAVGVGYSSDRSDWLGMMADVNVHMNNKGHAYLEDLILRHMGFPMLAGRPAGDVTSPTAPSSFAIGTTTSTTAPCSWTNGTDDVGIDHSEIYYRSPSGSGSWLTKTVAGAATSDTITGLSASTTIEAYVVHVDAAGNPSAPSNTDTDTTAAGGGGYRAENDANLIADVDPAVLIGSVADGAIIPSITPAGGSELGALTHANSGERPTFKASATNGKPALVFDGSNDKIISPAWSRSYGPGWATEPTPVTMFAVIKSGDSTGGDFCNGSASGVYLAARKTLANQISLYAGATTPTFGATDQNNVYEVVCIIWDGASSKIMVNQSTGGTTGSTGTGSNARLSGLRIGSNSDGSSMFFSGEVARLMLVKGRVSDPNIATEMLALGSEYGIAVA